MKLGLTATLLFHATLALAQGREHPCPMIQEVLQEVGYPRQALSDGIYKGEAVVAFTILRDGQTSDWSVASASDPIFGEAALAAIRRLRCNPRETDLRATQKITFAQPPSCRGGDGTVAECKPNAYCPNYEGITQNLRLPDNIFEMGLTDGEVTIEITLSPDGQVKLLRSIASSSKVFETAAIESLQGLKCNAPGRELRLLAPFAFKIQ